MKMTTWLTSLTGILALQLSAAPITYTATSGDRRAEVSFAMSGTNLTVTLTNQAIVDQNVPADVLTAVFFNLDGSPSLSTGTALLASGSTVVCGGGAASCGQPAGNVVGGEWAYKSGLSVTTGPITSHYGISSTGLGLFGPGARFPGANLQGPNSPDGIQYGIVSQAWNPAGDNGGVDGSGFIRNSVVFTLSGLANNADLASLVNNVAFQYGTALSEPRIVGTPNPPSQVPEPATYALMGAGLIGLYWMKRKPC